MSDRREKIYSLLDEWDGDKISKGSFYDAVEALYQPDLEKLDKAVELVKEQRASLPTIMVEKGSRMDKVVKALSALHKILDPPEKPLEEQAFEETISRWESPGCVIGDITNAEYLRREFKSNLERLRKEQK